MSESLSQCIRDGTFPESDALLGQDVSSGEITSLLASISKTKSELKDEIGAISQTVAGDVDEWIAQAKKVQDDILRCKIEARHIVEEHQRGETLRAAVKDTNGKVQLLEAEIAFSKALEHEMQNISEIAQILNEAERDLSIGNSVAAVGKLGSIEMAVESVSATKTKSMLLRLSDELRQRAQAALERSIATRWIIKKHDTGISLSVTSAICHLQQADAGQMPQSIDDVLAALQKLRALPSAITCISRIIESFMLSVTTSISTSYPSSLDRNEGSLTVRKGQQRKDVHIMLAIIQDIVTFLYETLPEKIRSDVAGELLPRIVLSFISEWLDDALPHELHDLQVLESLELEVSAVAETLDKYSWPGGDQLREWIEQIPRNWLTKRRVFSLEAVRKAFSLARGDLRPVERVEKQKITLETPNRSVETEEGDWNADWDDESQTQGVKDNTNAEEDDMSAWDFDTQDEQEKLDKPQEAARHGDDEDAGDAWGWGDEDNTNEQPQAPKPSSKVKAQQINGESGSGPAMQEMVLTESYHITDIPEYIVEIIGKDIADAHELQSSPTKYFQTSAPATGLLGLPNLILALFRATALTYYTLPSARYTLSNLNLYNDTLYIIQKLIENADTSSHILQSAIQSLGKFARQVYSAEIDVQRTIISDLLDGAQGFERCTVYPNSQACTDAVSSTVDRLRQLHTDWSHILGESHLLQSLGSLVTTVFGKMIKDVEDMDDISEQDSKQLVVYCQQILVVEELFTSSKRMPDLMTAQTTTDDTPGHTTTQILLYVPNYLRFQYLQQILESSLVDIKYLWTEGELGLEFSVDEVVDLIKALFAESQYRRDAVRAIRGSATG